MLWSYPVLLLSQHLCLSVATKPTNPPNIVFVLADDLGYNDVGWNNAASPTPHLTSLAEDGLILDSAYTLPVCSPSRAALLTGIYPYKFGFQRGFGPNLPEGLPLDMKILPEILQKDGYRTHALGKWHLGFCSEAYTPTNRGFDTFYGLYVGDEGFTEEDSKQHKKKLKQFRRKKNKYRRKSRKENQRKQNNKRVKPLGKKPKYSDYFNRTQDPMFSSLEYADKAVEIIRSPSKKPLFLYLSLLTKVYPFHGDISRDIHLRRAQKAWEMDQAVHIVVTTLQETGLYENTILVFVSDNGARFIRTARGSENPNFPLRGYKNTIYEGGTRVPGFIHSPLLLRTGDRHQGLLHMVDFLPTLLSIAGSSIPPGLDGVDQWSSLSEDLPSPRTHIVYNIDDVFVPSILAGPRQHSKFQIGIRDSRHKLVWGQASMLHRGYRKPQYSKGGENTEFQTLELYDLISDPGEETNLAKHKEEVVSKLQDTARELYQEIVPPRVTTSQGTTQVVDRSQPGGGLTGWCRPALRTVCTQLNTNSVEYTLNSSLVQLQWGTMDGGEMGLVCTTPLV